ncbi:MAG: hypothetical protein EXQ94_08900 [Alphaproteobacteria bacterium]|nr:hypothetical protein [Alphaproteobacteria bacterium]
MPECAASPEPNAKAPDPPFTRTYRLLVRGKNISEESLLATDYLNHFNEVVMLLEMVGAAPEFMDDVRTWKPRSYVEHFQGSVFANKELASFAYEQAPLAYRIPFDDLVRTIDTIILGGPARLDAALVEADEVAFEDAASETATQARTLIDQASGIIHGHTVTSRQVDIDLLLGAQQPRE